MLTRLFGRKMPAPHAPQPKPIDPSVLEYRRLNELPRPAIKRLPLDAEAVDACGPPSSLHPPVVAARTIDEVPADYKGDLYFRIVPSQRGAARNMRRYVGITQIKGVVLEDQPGQRLAAAWASHMAQGVEPRVFAPPGKLLPDLAGALPGRLLASAKKPFSELVHSNWPIASARFRRALESLEPGVHLFLPLDTSERADPPTLYLFYAGVLFRPTALAVSANGIGEHMLPDAAITWGAPKLSARHFYYLNRNVIGSSDVFEDAWLGTIFSRRALERLGDVVPLELAFMPMGVCEEPLPVSATRRTRDGATRQLV